jgi:macrodomain Ter protein organizer (MatP/YcbG family)
MDIRDEMLDWFERDQVPEDWVLQHLVNKALKKTGATGFIGEISVFEWADRLRNTPENTLLFISMKKAWDMKQRRKIKTDKKPCSFELDITVKSLLDYLAQRQSKTITKTLEDLIKRAAESAKKADSKAVKALEDQEIIPNCTKFSDLTVGDLTPNRDRKTKPCKVLEGKTVKDLRNGVDMTRRPKRTQDDLTTGILNDNQTKKPRAHPLLEGITIQDLQDNTPSKRQSRRPLEDFENDTPDLNTADIEHARRPYQRAEICIDERPTVLNSDREYTDSRYPGLTFDEPQPDQLKVTKSNRHPKT